MKLTPARSAGHGPPLKHGGYPSSILVKFSFPIKNISDRLWCATLRAKTITIISHVTWFGKLVRVWLSELWGKGKHWVWAWERCWESRSSPLVMCKVRDGARIESGSMLGKRLQPSDKICAFTRSGGEKMVLSIVLMLWSSVNQELHAFDQVCWLLGWIKETMFFLVNRNLLTRFQGNVEFMFLFTQS